RGRVTGLAWRWPCAAAISWRITSPCFRSNAVTVIPRHCAVARIRAAYISFNTGRSPNPFAITFIRRRLPKEPSQQIRGPNHRAMTNGEAHMRRARREVLPEALNGRGQVRRVPRDGVVPRGVGLW